MVHIPENASYILVYSLVQHPQLGWLIEPFIVQTSDAGKLSLVHKRVHAQNAESYKKALKPVDYKIIEHLEHVDPQQITNKFSKKKRVKASDYLKKEWNKKLHDQLIRPYIEGQLVKALSLFEDGDVLYQYKDKNPAAQQFVFSTEPASTLFHLRRNLHGTRYFATIKHKGEKVNYMKTGSVLPTHQPAFLFAEGKVLSFDEHLDGKKLAPFLGKKFIAVDPDNEESFLKKFAAPLLEKHSVYAEGISIETTKPMGNPVLRLCLTLAGKKAFALAFNYRNKIVPFGAGKKVSVNVEKRGEEWVLLRMVRSEKFEKAIFYKLEGMGLKHTQGAEFVVPNVANDDLDTIRWVQLNKEKILAEGFEIEYEWDKGWVLDQPRIEMQSQEQKDWFDIKADLHIGDEVIPLSYLIEYIQNGTREVTLPSGSKFIIPEEWFSTLPILFGIGQRSKQQFRLNKRQKKLLGNVKATLAQEEIEDFDLEKELKDIDLTPSAQFNGELRSYQLNGAKWMKYLANNEMGGCLADDMGLGKTVQTLALLQYEKENAAVDDCPESEKKVQLDIFSEEGENIKPKVTSLLVVPTSLIYNWTNEAKKFTPNLNVLLYTGSNRHKNIANFSNVDLVITTYGLLRNDIEMLSEFNFHYGILDESQVIKNPNSQTAKAARKLNSRYKLTLTGTPIENTLMDLWSQMSFLNPGLLGTHQHFQKTFVQSIEGQKNPERSAILRQLVAPYILRRTKEQVAPELPEKSVEHIYCDMTEDQEKLYEKIKSQYRNHILKAVKEVGIKKSKIHIIKGLTELRLIANHPELYRPEEKIESGKFKTLIAKALSVVNQGHKILIFSQFVKHLKLIEQELKLQGLSYCYLDGATPSAERNQQVERFQNDTEIPIFLISLKAGGAGLNLTSADYVFITDPWWNPAVESQAIDRAHRIGQDKKVFCYKMISSHTVEEKIVQLQKRKSQLSDQILKENGSVLSGINEQELSELLD